MVTSPFHSTALEVSDVTRKWQSYCDSICQPQTAKCLLAENDRC
jgi:hypothetical protein